MLSIAAVGTSSGKVRWVAVGLSCLLAATVGDLSDPAQAQAVSRTSVTTADQVAEKVLERPDRTSAFLAAQLQGSRVEVAGERTENTTLWANPGGTLTVDESTGPVRVLQGEKWVPVNMDLHAVEGGFAPKASPATVKFSPGGDGPAVKLSEGSKKVWLNWTDTLPAPTVEGARATYTLDANTDLVLTALPEGFAQSLVLKAPPATAPKIHLPLDLTGLAMGDAGDGQGFEFTNSAGEVVFSTPKPQMWDSQLDELDLPANRRPIAVTQVDSAADAQLDLSPSMAWLSDPALSTR